MSTATNLNSLAIDDLTLGGTALAATAAEINRVAQASSRIVAAGATLTATQALHDSKTVLLDTAAGSVVTLPAASGSGTRIKFLVSVIATSNSHIVKGYTADATAGADTITLNRTTTGSTVKGEWISVEDVAANKWAVLGMIASTGTEATPFSATV